jgi:two-component system OmpR family response regulator
MQRAQDHNDAVPREESPGSLPATLAIIDDDRPYMDFLAESLREKGIEVTVFADSDDFLINAQAFGFEFYLVDLMLPGVDGVDLVRLLRRRTDAGIVVMSGRVGPDVFNSVMVAGADMYLAKPVRFDQVALAIGAVHRRVGKATVQSLSWLLDRKRRALVTPGGVRIQLSETDLRVLECFVDAAGAPVTHTELRQRFDGDDASKTDNWLHATIYRLRRRIEQATSEIVPLQSQPRIGYIFRGELTAE